MSKPADYDNVFKIVIIGDTGVGKSNLLLRYTRNEFNPEFKATIGAEFATKTVQIEQRKVSVQAWDTSGSEQYRSVTSTYYRGALGALLCYDITKKLSFENLPRWLGDLRNQIDSRSAILVVGNKSDLKEFREVSKEEAQEFAEKNGLEYMETSALEPENVDAAFMEVIKEIHKLLQKHDLDANLKKSVLPDNLKDSILLTTPSLKKRKKKACDC